MTKRLEVKISTETLRALKILAIAYRSSIKGQAESLLEDAAMELFADVTKNPNSKFALTLKRLNEEDEVRTSAPHPELDPNPLEIESVLESERPASPESEPEPELKPET